MAGEDNLRRVGRRVKDEEEEEESGQEEEPRERNTRRGFCSEAATRTFRRRHIHSDTLLLTPYFHLLREKRIGIEYLLGWRPPARTNTAEFIGLRERTEDVPIN